jgi:hypothetical protein
MLVLQTRHQNYALFLFVCLSIYVCTSSSLCLSVCLFFGLLSVCLFVKIFVCLSVCLFFWLSVCLLVSLSRLVFFKLLHICLSSGSFFYLSKVTVSFLVYLSVSSSFNWLGKINCRPPNLSGEVSTTARVSVNRLYIFVSMFIVFIGLTFYHALKKDHELNKPRIF